MDEQFDDQLKSYISKAFEKIDYPTADEGWLMLRKKFPAKDKDRPVLWIWRAAVAAIVLLALGIGTWFNYQNNAAEVIAKKSSKNQRTEEKNNQLAIKKAPLDKRIDSTISVNRPVTIGKTIDWSKIKTQPVAGVADQINPSNQIITKPILDNYANNLPASPIPDKATINIKTVDKDSAISKPDQMASNQKPAERPLLSNKNTVYNIQDNKPVDPITDNEKKVKFGVYAATYVNYAKGSENQINMGVGFTSDIKISKKVKLSTGVAIAQNSLNYINQLPAAPLRYIATTYNTVSTASSFGVANTYNFNNASNTPAVKDYNALLVGLDIPLNLKYEFNPQKRSSYIIVGLSSGTFINESYTYNFNTLNNYAGGNLALLANQQAPQSQTTKNSFNDFYFAKTLNVSFGIGYTVGKNNLIIEPFLKYPLAGLGAQQIHFGAGGINLKFDFQSSKR